jgi:cardiolipin hydrolase
MHNKIAVIDALVVLIGSFNWIKKAEEKNEENVLVTDEPEVVKIYQERLGYLWQWNR